MADQKYIKINGVMIPAPLDDSKFEDTSVEEISSNLPSFKPGSLGRNMYTFNNEVVDIVKKYNIDLQRDMKKEDLNKYLANAQSWEEQFGRMLGQMVVSEIALGTVLGFSDIADWMINIGKAYGEDDWTNPVSSKLTEWQDALKEQWKIYRENPEKSWDITDSAWWFDNGVQIGSTLSLMIPAAGVTRGISYIGKLTKFDRLLNKASYNIAKGIRSVSALRKGEQATSGFTIARNLQNGMRDATRSVISRQMEDMLEGRETYKQVKQSTDEQLKNMTAEEREEFFARNPEFVGKTDEEISRYIADKAAQNTFEKDFKFVLTDFLAWKSIGHGYLSKTPTRKLNNAQIDVLQKMAGMAGLEAENTMTKLGVNASKRNWLSYYAEHPSLGIQKTLGSLSLEEGVEEFGQGLVQKKSEEIAYKYFDPKYTERSMASYLRDGQLWEQAFWGAIGGITFGAAHKGFDIVLDKIKLAKKKDKLSKEDILNLELGEERTRRENIESWATEFAQMKAKMDLYNQGYNPYTEIAEEDEDGKISYREANKEGEYEQLTDDNREAIKNKILDEFVDKTAYKSIDYGTINYLEALINDPVFDEIIKKVGGSTIDADATLNRMKTQLAKSIQNYGEALYNVFANTDVESEAVGRAVARNIAANKFRIDQLDTMLDYLNNEINKQLDSKTDDNIDYNVSDSYHKAKLREQLLDTFKDLYKQVSILKNKNIGKNSINETFRNSVLDELRRVRNEYIKLMQDVILFTEALKDENGNIKLDESSNALYNTIDLLQRAINEEEISDEEEIKLLEAIDTFSPKDFGKTGVTEQTRKLIDRKVAYELEKAKTQAMVPTTDSQLKEAVKDMEAAFGDIISSRVNKDLQSIVDYIQNSENPEQAFENLMNDNAPENIQEAFNYFKVGDENYAYHLETFKLAANIKEKKKQMAVPKTDSQTSNNTTLETTEEIENTPTEQQSPSTGVQIESENNTFEEVNEPDEDDVAVQEIIENNGLEEVPIEVNEVEYSDEDIKREGFIRSIVPTKLKDASNETRIGIRENGIEGEEFKDFIRSCVDDLKQNPIFKNISEQDLTRTIEQEFANTLELISPSSSINIQNVYNKLIDDIRNKKYSAETKLITNSDIENEADKIINDYLKDYENKDIPIDLRDFFDYIVENYKGNLVNILNPIIYRFTQDINSDIHKYKINEKTSYLIQKYKESPTKFLQELLSRKTKNSLISDELPSFHSQMPANAYNGFKYIQLRNIKGEKQATEEIFGKRNIKIVDNGINRTEVNETEIRKDEAIQAYIDWFTAIQSYKENPEAKLIVYQVGAAFNIRLYDGSVSLLDLQKAEHLNKTIAFLARVEPILINGKNNNNAFAKIVTKNSYGLRYKVYKSDDGTITTNFDDLYNKIINDDVIYNMILNEQTNFSKDELKQLYDYFKDYINVKKDETAADIILKDYNEKSLNENNAKDLLRYLHEIFGNYRERGGNKKSAQESFDEFKQKLYSNYSLTYTLDSRFEENKKNHKYTVLDLREIPIVEEIITQVKNPYSINKERFDPKTAKLVYVDNDYRIHIGNSDKSFDNPFNIHTNNIGIILKEYDDGRLPLIALSMGGNLVKDTNPLYSPLRNTISYLVKQCYDANKSGNSIKILVEQLKELIGKESVFYRKPSDGYKSFVDEVVKLVYKQKNYNEELVDKLMNGITFNPSVALAKGKLNSTNNFISIDNGKLTINLPNEKGDVSFNYDSYAQFCIENEAFNINQDLTVDPNIPNSILFDSSIKELSNTKSPVKGGKVLKQISALKDALNELGKNDKIETKRVLKIAGFTEKDIETLLGKNSNISFIDSTIKFDKDSQDNDFAYYDKGSSDIYLTNRIFNEENIPTEIDTFKYNIARLIIHENVHKNFDKLSKDDKKVVINHLKDIFLDFADYYITDIDTSANNKFAKSIAKGFENTRWSLDNIKDLKKLIEENTIDEEELIDNMNEFFAETLSQPYLIKYLDSKEYRRERINVEDSDTPKDSIWTKIVRLIVEFFNKIESNFFENLSINNLDNSEKISIFAEEYKLLSILGGDKIVTKKDSIAVAKDNIGKDGQLSLQFDEEPTTEQIDNLIDEEAEDAAIRKAKYTKKKISAQTPMITPFEVRSKINDDNGNFDSSGIRRVPSMTDFVKSRKYTEQAIISSLLKSGAFEYACK